MVDCRLVPIKMKTFYAKWEVFSDTTGMFKC